MPSLLIRKLDEPLHRLIKDSARANHRSVEEEARELLRSAIAYKNCMQTKENIIDIADRIFGPLGGVVLDIPARIPSREPPDFSASEFDP